MSFFVIVICECLCFEICLVNCVGLLILLSFAIWHVCVC